MMCHFRRLSACTRVFDVYAQRELTLTATHANGALVSLRTHAGDYIARINCYVRKMITAKHHILSTEKTEFHNVVMPSPGNPKCNIHVDKNVTVLAGHCDSGNNHFDLHQQQDLAQELGDGDYDVCNHSSCEHKNEVARTIIRQYRPCRCQS